MTTAPPESGLPAVLIHRHPKTLEILGVWLMVDPDKEPTPYYDSPDPFWQQTAQRDLDQKGPDPDWQQWADELTWRTPTDAWWSVKPARPGESAQAALERLRVLDGSYAAKAAMKARRRPGTNSRR